jgi:hypothetical protein
MIGTHIVFLSDDSGGIPLKFPWLCFMVELLLLQQIIFKLLSDIKFYRRNTRGRS